MRVSLHQGTFLIGAPTREKHSEAGTYLDDRQSKGFNVVLAMIEDHKFCPNCDSVKRCPNRNGIYPFANPNDFSSRNDAYFAHLDTIFDVAAARGICIELNAMYQIRIGRGYP